MRSKIDSFDAITGAFGSLYGWSMAVLGTWHVACMTGVFAHFMTTGPKKAEFFGQAWDMLLAFVSAIPISILCVFLSPIIVFISVPVGVAAMSVTVAWAIPLYLDLQRGRLYILLAVAALGIFAGYQVGKLLHSLC